MNKQNFRQELLDCLDHNILSFWSTKMVDPRGGFYGRMDGNDQLDAEAPKGAILNGRILWSFASAYRVTKNPTYLEMAQRAKRYLLDHFIDPEYGGVYWSVNADGTPLDPHKQFYAIGFVIYGMSELARAAGDAEALECAKALFKVIEAHSYDAENGGYLEAMTRDWKPIDDMRLSDKDENFAKTMNTHLHIIEPYTNLYRVWPDAALKKQILHLMHIFLDVILDHETWHMGLFYDLQWHRHDRMESYGHDIEASWLLMETAMVINDPELLAKTKDLTKKLALASMRDGKKADGSMIYEKREDGSFHTDLDWWVQCECVIGQVYLYCFHGDESALAGAYQTWQWIKANLLDVQNGEWHWGRHEDGSINRSDDKAGFWKCPYHNSRMCLEVYERLEADA